MMMRPGVSRLHRRSFLAGVAVAGFAAALRPAFAGTPIDEILAAPQRGNWSDQFDARSSTRDKVATNLPIMSTETVSYITAAIEQYRQIVASGGWPMVPATKDALRLGAVDPAVSILRKRLMISGDLSTVAGISDAFDTYVDAAVKRFQARHGLPADGVLGSYTLAAMNVSAEVRLGQLETNLQRLSDLTAKPLGDRFVMVNIPAAQVEAVENGRVVQRHTAIVGKIDRQTPVLSSKINEIILNPYWTAPKSIIVKDLIPLVKKDPAYLSQNKIRIFDKKGNELSPDSIDWDSDQAADLLFRQDPSKINAMASTKINFFNPYDVYMHDTPQQSLFGKLERFESSGCVRVQNVRDLTTWLLKDTPGWNRQAIEDMIRTGINTPIELTDKVPVYFVYVTAWSTGDGVVHFRDDIYHRDGPSELALGTPL